MAGVIGELDALPLVGRETDAPHVAAGEKARNADHAFRDEFSQRDSSSAAIRRVRRIIVTIVPRMITISASMRA